MNINNFVKSAAGTGVIGLMLAVGASAATVTFQTDIGSGFNGGTGLSLGNSGGAAATLAFVPDGPAAVGYGNVNYGNWTLTCALCTTQAGGGGSVFGAFTFNLKVTDTTDNASGIFVGTSAGGSVFTDVSTITISWAPTQLGAGTGAWTGNFGTNYFNINPTTRIVNPDSGAQPGTTTTQGTLASTAAPEPATLSLIGGALLGLGVLRRKHLIA